MTQLSDKGMVQTNPELALLRLVREHWQCTSYGERTGETTPKNKCTFLYLGSLTKMLSQLMLSTTSYSVIVHLSNRDVLTSKLSGKMALKSQLMLSATQC